MKRHGQEYGPDLVAISDVAKHLVDSGVRCAVLNACRSAYTGEESLNIATSLIGLGLDAVLAMSYKITSSAVEVFVGAFYRNLFDGNGCFEDSSSAARAALAAHPLKTTKFNEQVDVADSIVPICLLSHSGDTLLFSADWLDEGVVFDHLDFLKDDDEYPIGRENDILLLENSLLLESNIGLLVGSAGSGKTKLLEYAASWWEATNLVQRTFWAYLDDMKAGIDLQNLPIIFEDLISPEEGPITQEVFEYLRSNRTLIVFDGIESYVCPNGSPLSRQQKYLKAFLRELYGGKTLILLSSRRSESWLGKLGPRKSEQEAAPTTFTRPLEGLAVLQGVQVATKVIQERRKGVPLDREDNTFIEQLVKLVEGNPLALEILIIDFCQKSLSFEDYYYALIEGAEIQLDHRWLKATDGARGAVELSNLMHKAITPSEEERQKMAEASMIAIFANKPIPMRGLIHAMPPSLLGMMWRAVGSDELIYYAMFFSMVSASSLSVASSSFRVPTDDEMNTAMMVLMTKPAVIRPLFEEVMYRDENMQQLKELLDELVDKLLTRGYLELPSTNMRNLPQKPYYRIHPLLPIIARTSPDFTANQELMREAFLKYQTFCLGDWPHHYMYWNPAWEQPKLEMSLTFINFYAALRIGLRRDASPEYSNESAIVMLMTCINKGTFADPSRQDLLKPLWAFIVSRVLRMRDFLLSDKSDSISKSVPTVLLSQDLSEERRRTYSFALLRMLYAGQLCIGGYGMVLTGQLKEQDPLLAQILGILDQDLATKPFDSRLEHLNSMFDVWKYFPKMIRVAAFKSPDEPAAWHLRETFIRERIKSQGVEEYPVEQRGWRDIPYSQNSMSVPFVLLIDVAAKVKVMASAGQYAEARVLLQTKLDVELNRGGNQPRSIATIYEIMYWLSKKEEKWLDAISHLNRARTLRESTNEMNAMRRVSWEGKLAKLYEKSGDLETTVAYVKLLLSKANVAHATDPALEIACLHRIWKLQYSRRLDGMVSSIFLAVRAALTAHRTDCTYNRISKGQWPLLPLLITLTSIPIWGLGATDPRPQTIAIVYLLTMFGVKINLSYFLHCQDFLMGGPRQNLEKAVEAGLELEQRLFTSPGAPLTHVHYSPQETFEPQRRLFDHLYSCGERYLAGDFSVKNGEGKAVFPETPFAPSTILGNTATGGFFGNTVATSATYRCPTRIMLQLAGYLIDWPE